MSTMPSYEAMFRRSDHKTRIFNPEDIRRASRFCKKARWWWPFHRKGYQFQFATIEGVYWCNKCSRCGVLTLRKGPTR